MKPKYMKYIEEMLSETNSPAILGAMALCLNNSKDKWSDEGSRAIIEYEVEQLLKTATRINSAYTE